MITDNEKEPFVEIAKRKNKIISFVTSDTENTEWPENYHLDMDMVDASIKNTIARIDKPELAVIRGKLEVLLSNGTDAEKVEFVLGSGTYYFPEDLNRMAILSKEFPEKTPSSKKTCETVCRVVCSCLGGGSQECKEFCRLVCSFSE